MNRITTIPAQITSVVRCAVIVELGNAAAEIEKASLACEIEDCRENFTELLKQFDAVRALLEEIGWSNTQRTIDLGKHLQALVNALKGRLAIDRYFANDPTTAPTSRKATERDIRGVEGFLAVADLRGDE